MSNIVIHINENCPNEILLFNYDRKMTCWPS